MKRILSGIQPSGQLHLGNYFGMMTRMIQYQEKNELFAFIVNYHALTTIQDGNVLKENTFQAACDFLALGLDPKKATFWIQGDVPQVTELTWILSNVVNVGLLQRSTSYKDKISQGLTSNAGLFTYPILMAADILLFGADIVPVGKDQKQHLEMARDMANRFNQTFREVFIIPEEDINHETQLVPGIDGRKMSKSYDNTIPVFCDEKTLKKKVMSIVTDSTPVSEPKSIDSPIFQIYSLFLDENEKIELKNRFKTPGLKYGDVKNEIFERIWIYFEPYRTNRAHLINNKDHVENILSNGAEKASEIGEIFLEKVRNAVGLNY